MKSSKKQLEARGFVDDKKLEYFNHYSKIDLLKMLDSSSASDRTIAAKLLAKHKNEQVVQRLLDTLKIEKKLYTKIALSQTLASYNELSCEKLIKCLGTIGNNQHRSLPSKEFGKSSYPLPRDIVARTLCKMGKCAIRPLINCLSNGQYSQILEAVDAIGFISYYENDATARKHILSMFNKYSDDQLMTWKLLGALQAFDGDDVMDMLNGYTQSPVTQHRFEAIRSISQIANK